MNWQEQLASVDNITLKVDILLGCSFYEDSAIIPITFDDECNNIGI